MDKDRLNNMVVDLFHGISYEEEKAVITDEFKDISNKDLHIIDAIGIKKPKNMSTIAELFIYLFLRRGGKHTVITENFINV